MSTGTGNEIDTIIDMLGGIFEGASMGIRQARAEADTPVVQALKQQIAAGKITFQENRFKSHFLGYL